MQHFLTSFILLFTLLQPMYGQLTESMIKSNFIINIIKFVEWENEDTIRQFTLGVLGKDEIFEEFKKRAIKTKLKGKDFNVIQLRKMNDIKDVQILYVDKRSSNAVRKILDNALEAKILMFSDSCLDQEAIMINLLDIDMPGNQFEINRTNLEQANFLVSPKLLYYGGSQADLREIYQASEQELSQVQQTLEQQTALLKKQQEELEIKQQEIQVLIDEIAIQEEHLDSMTAEIEAKQDSLNLKIALLQSQEMRIRGQQADIENQNIQLLKQKQEITAGNLFLNQQKLEIDSQEQKIKNQLYEIQNQSLTLQRQTGEIQEQTLTIEKQQTLLYYFVAFFAVFIAMIFFILRAYRIKRQAHKKLEEKNTAISKQKEEIQSQQEQLKLINQKIEKQNENIKSSIHYALTIQKALLPSKEEMEELFESFVIYRPRDIVSGDFYWMSDVEPENGVTKKTFTAVADCTGHGVPGAFLSMIGIKLLNSIVNERKQYNPRVILEMLNSAVQNALKQEKNVSDDGMDICLCRMEKTKENEIKIKYSGARRPLYYSNNREIKILRGDRKTIGGRFYKTQVFTNQEILLTPGERIYLATDGIADQNGPNRQKFGSKKLIKLLEDSLHLSMKEQKEYLENALNTFQENEKQRDDISLLAIKI